jgi:SOS-response transcriptional repressor LexA
LLFNNPNIAIYKNRGDSMNGAGIFDNDYVVVDTSKHKIDNQIVLPVVNNEYSTIKRFIRYGDMVKLACVNGSSEFIFVDSKNVQVIGVVTGFFRNFS